MNTPRSSGIALDFWSPAEEMLISVQGAHMVPFTQEFPFELKYYQFLIDHRVTPNFHDYLEVTYVYQGHGVFHVGENS